MDSDNVNLKDFIPKEVIVVEGRDDTKRLIETFGPRIKTIETGGSAVSEQTIQRIIKAEESFGAIIFTDPDFQGDRIRRIVSQAAPTAKHAYLSRQEARASSSTKSLGVEHASSAALIDALRNIVTPSRDRVQAELTISELIDLGLTGKSSAQKRRQAVAQRYHLGNLNTKQLQKQLALYQIDYADLKKFLKELEQNDQ